MGIYEFGYELYKKAKKYTGFHSRPNSLSKTPSKAYKNLEIEEQNKYLRYYDDSSDEMKRNYVEGMKHVIERKMNNAEKITELEWDFHKIVTKPRFNIYDQVQYNETARKLFAQLKIETNRGNLRRKLIGLTSMIGATIAISYGIIALPALLPAWASYLFATTSSYMMGFSTNGLYLLTAAAPVNIINS